MRGGTGHHKLSENCISEQYRNWVTLYVIHRLLVSVSFPEKGDANA